MKHLTSALVLIVPTFPFASADASVTEYTVQSQWVADAATFSTIDFTGFPNGTFITTQYSDIGVIFTDGDDNIGGPDFFTCPEDGWCLDGNFSISLSFIAPMTAIAADFPSGLKYELFSDGELIYTSSNFAGSGPGHFAGLISTEAFDAVVLSDWQPPPHQVAIDNLYFGPPIPAASTMPVVLLAAGIQRRRRSH